MCFVRGDVYTNMLGWYDSYVDIYIYMKSTYGERRDVLCGFAKVAVAIKGLALKLP